MKPPAGWKLEALDPGAVARLCRGVDVDAETGCWVWRGYKDHKGYGQIKVGGKVRWAHRFAYVVFNGEIPINLTVHHIDKCRNPSCCNPDHLDLKTRPENTADGNRARRRAMA